MKIKSLPLALTALVASLALVVGCQSPPAGPAPTATTAALAAAASPTAAQAATPTVAAVPSPTTAPPATATAASAPVVNSMDMEMSWEQVITAPGTDPQTMKVYFKQGKSRVEMETMGEEAVMISDLNENVAYMYMPSQAMALKIPLDMAEDQAGPDVTELADEATQGTLVGTETIDGKVADVYEYTVDGEKTKTWIWKERGFPLKTEIETAEGTTVMEMRNIAFDGVDDALFELPADVEITDMGAIPGMPANPGG